MGRKLKRRGPNPGRWVSAGALLLAAATPALWAGERVTLTNGFDLVCDHRETVGDRVRLFLERGSASFVEVASSEIAATEAVADPAPATSAVEGTVTTALAAHAVPAVLTPVEMHEMLAQAGARHNVDRELLASVVRAESGGRVRAVSRAGAQGLMQLMPGTAAELGVGDSFVPEQNVDGGSAYLDALLTRYHDNLALALAAYNAGPAAVDRWHGIPPYRETRLYVARVIREFNRRIEAEGRAANHAPMLAKVQTGPRTGNKTVNLTAATSTEKGTPRQAGEHTAKRRDTASNQGGIPDSRDSGAQLATTRRPDAPSSGDRP